MVCDDCAWLGAGWSPVVPGCAQAGVPAAMTATLAPAIQWMRNIRRPLCCPDKTLIRYICSAPSDFDEPTNHPRMRGRGQPRPPYFPRFDNRRSGAAGRSPAASCRLRRIDHGYRSSAGDGRISPHHRLDRRGGRDHGDRRAGLSRHDRRPHHQHGRWRRSSGSSSPVPSWVAACLSAAFFTTRTASTRTSPTPPGAITATAARAGLADGWDRTHGELAPTAVFKTAALNHSATHPLPSGAASTTGRSFAMSSPGWTVCRPLEPLATHPGIQLRLAIAAQDGPCKPHDETGWRFRAFWLRLPE